MSTLVTSAAPMLIIDGAAASNTGVVERSASINSSTQQFASNIQYSQNQQMLTSTAPAQLLQPAQYSNNVPFPYTANNYNVAARNAQLQSQQQQQLHLNALQQQLLAGRPASAIAYHQQQQQCSMTPSVASSTSTSHHPTTTAAVPATTTTTSTSINRSQRCGVCRGCQCKPCGTCTYCQDSPQFGGPGVKKQSCIERRCLRVLENRLQRDAPTFKARVGCHNCDDCKMPDCQICLVCLDRRFFNNRYMNGALCAKKRCNNATSLDLSPQGLNNNSLSSADRNQQLKRSFDNNNYDQVTAKRREIKSLQHMQAQQLNHQKLSHKNGIDAQQLSLTNFQQANMQIPSASPNSVSPPSSNCSQQPQTPSTTVITMNKNVDTITQQHRQHQILHPSQLASQDEKYGFRPIYNGATLQENGTAETYQNTSSYTSSAIPTTTAATMQTVCVDAALQHLPPQNGNFYIASTASPFFNNNNNNNIHQQFDMTAATAAAAAAGLPPNHFLYQQHQQHQQQQQLLQSQLCCNNYMQQQKFSNYPKYEYYDEHTVYGTIQNGIGCVLPPDPFVPPSYSEMKNAVVLQPL